MPLQNFKGLGKLACFHCMLGCLVSGSSWCIQVSLPVTMRFTNKFQFNCINFKFSLNVSRQKSFIFWSSIRGTHRAQTLVINKIRARSSLLDRCLCPLCRLSDAHWLDDFAEQQFPQHDSFPRRQLRTDVLTWVHIRSFFCLDGTRQLSVLLRHMTAHLHRIQQSFTCVSAVAKHSPVSKTLITAW